MFLKYKWFIWRLLFLLNIYKHPRLKFIDFQKKININNKYSYKRINEIIKSLNFIETKPPLEIIELMESFKNKFKYNSNNLKILIVSPLVNVSPGAYSLYHNLCQSLQFIGIETKIVLVNQNIKLELETFKPNILLNDDFKYIFDAIDPNLIVEYRKTNKLFWGLNAYIDNYGFNESLKKRIEYAKKNPMHDVMR